MASDVFAKHFCTYCQEENNSLRVKCNDCPSFELCLQCFSAGAEIGCHKRDHAYQFIDSVGCDVFRDRSSWTGREELHLLNAIEHYSYGNWKDISQHIGTRSPEEAREEYVGRFLGGDIGRHTWSGLRGRNKLSDLTVGREDDPHALPPHNPTNAQPPSVRTEDASQLDYMPLRDEFEVEYDNDAETLVSHLTLSPDDDELDIALKIAQVEMYTQRLRERERRHRVVQDNQLIAQYFNNKDKPKKKISREERELGEKLRPLCKEQEQTIMVGVMNQRRLSRVLAECMRFRRNGLTRAEEIPHFDQERHLRHNTKPDGTVTSLEDEEDGTVSSSVEEEDGTVSSSLDDEDVTDEEEEVEDDVDVEEEEEEDGSGSASIQHFQVGSKKKEKNEAGKSSRSVSSVSDYSESESATEFLANSHLLSANEIQLCIAMELTPTQYISMKTLMLMDPQTSVDGECGQHILDHLVISSASGVTDATQLQQSSPTDDQCQYVAATPPYS